MVCVLVFAIGALNTPYVAAEDTLPKQAPTARSLEETVLWWRRNMFSDDATERKGAIEAMLPTDKDVATLFPTDAQKLTQLLQLGKRNLIERSVDAPASKVKEARDREGNCDGAEVYDVRLESDIAHRRHAAVIEMIPQHVAVYRVITTRNGRTAGGSASYIFVNGRWRWWQGFDSVPEMLPQIDDILKRAEKRPGREVK